MFTGRRHEKIRTCADLTREFNSDVEKVANKEMKNRSLVSKWNFLLRERPDCSSLKKQVDSRKSI